MAAGIASGFVRKLYRILDHEDNSIISWDASGKSFSIHNSEQLNETILPRYFRGRMTAFRQQLIDHGFEQLEVEDNDSRESYYHDHFLRGCPARLGHIVRVPKSKKKVGTAPNMSMQPSTPASTMSPVTSSLSVHIAPTMNGSGRTPLAVKLNPGKRPSPNHAASSYSHHVDKRLRPSLTAPSTSSSSYRNPLFTNDPDEGLDVARVFSLGRISDTGIFPCSTDLPEPISYLNKVLAANGSTSASMTNESSVASIIPSIDTPMFSEDMIKSALYFLVSTSTTGTGLDQNSTSNHHTKTSTFSASEFMSSLLASSTNGGLTNGKTSGASSSEGSMTTWTNNSNPLFSDHSTVDDEEEDSIWNLLVAASIDRVKMAMNEVTNPQEKLKLILEERERLEEQRKKICPKPTVSSESSMPPNSLFSGSSSISKPLKSALKKPANSLFQKSISEKNSLFEKSTTTTINSLFSNEASSTSLFSKQPSANPLFINDVTSTKLTIAKISSTEPNTTKHENPLFAEPSAGPRATGAPTEDGLWRLLMSSSVDWLRKSAAEFDV